MEHTHQMKSALSEMAAIVISGGQGHMNGSFTSSTQMTATISTFVSEPQPTGEIKRLNSSLFRTTTTNHHLEKNSPFLQMVGTNSVTLSGMMSTWKKVFMAYKCTLSLAIPICVARQSILLNTLYQQVNRHQTQYRNQLMVLTTANLHKDHTPNPPIAPLLSQHQSQPSVLIPSLLTNHTTNPPIAPLPSQYQSQLIIPTNPNLPTALHLSPVHIQRTIQPQVQRTIQRQIQLIIQPQIQRTTQHLTQLSAVMTTLMILLIFKFFVMVHPVLKLWDRVEHALYHLFYLLKPATQVQFQWRLANGYF
mmetsp:Transcript_890/g.1625  ORF Transcript_890/g.1625 Transcript_890/m.1625 type:complete len:306 (+) Transcript_890:1128-2045(+)